MSDYDNPDLGDTASVELAQELLDRCLDRPLTENSPQWRYLTETRGLPASAVRFCSTDLRVLEPPIPGFDRLAHGTVSLLRDSKGEITGLATEPCGVAGERVLDKAGRTARKTFRTRAERRT